MPCPCRDYQATTHSVPLSACRPSAQRVCFPPSPLTACQQGITEQEPHNLTPTPHTHSATKLKLSRRLHSLSSRSITILLVVTQSTTCALSPPPLENRDSKPASASLFIRQSVNQQQPLERAGCSSVSFTHRSERIQFHLLARSHHHSSCLPTPSRDKNVSRKDKAQSETRKW